MRPVFSGTCRKFVLNVGPTNSGKTFHGLEELKKAATGVYASPLRLLAHEAYVKLNSSGVPCDLLTGQQRIRVPNSKHVACTVEMMPSNQPFEVGVIDEIQMISDPNRGWSWTRVLAQNQVDKMILCGQPNAVPLVSRILKNFKRSASVAEVAFERFNKLVVEDRPAGKIRSGDAVICFSRKELYRIKHVLENEGSNVSIVYGSLPPEARIVQAEEFNQGASVLVATDAVGLGLNLKISRVVFSTTQKFDGQEVRPLTACEVRQLAGRSGRGQSDKFGLVTAFTEEDRLYIKKCLESEAPNLEKAGFLPGLPDLLVLNGGDVRDNVFLSDLYEKFLEAFRDLPPSPDFFLCEMDTILAAASVCDAEAPDLPLETRFTYSLAPIDLTDDVNAKYFTLYLKMHAANAKVKLMVKVFQDDNEIVRAVSEEERAVIGQRILRLESIYEVIDCYLWLATRFGDQIYVDRVLAEETKEKCAFEIDRNILRLGFRSERPSRKTRRRR